MNKQEADVLKTIIEEDYINQRMLSEQSGYSLGTINKCVKALILNGYLNEEIRPTQKAICELEDKKPKNAIILAAGFGMRMVPINMETPKGLLEVKGEPLIERMIKHLREVGVMNVYIVVGFMKEQYEYLIDKYGVELVVNSDYATKNNLHSVKRVLKYLRNSYIVPCDIWCEVNPFSQIEPYSWYMVSEEYDSDSTVRVNRRNELVSVDEKKDGNAMIGITYLTGQEVDIISENILRLCLDSRCDSEFWETALYNKGKMLVMAKVVPRDYAVEINTYEQLRELDSNSSKLKTDAITVICEALQVESNEITDITVLKKGMTNRSFLFKCKEKRYIMRIPGEGTEQLINRSQEADVYMKIAKEHICDTIVYINPRNGYKITEYLENARNCDPYNQEDLQKSMRVLRKFHEKELKVEHEFDIFKQIDFYESLWEGQPSVFKDYKETKEKVFSLQTHINQYNSHKVLTHIDAVPDNFLFVKQADGEEQIRLIDWEYAGMQDPHVDVAMFCIYAMYDREHVEQLIDYYFEEGCSKEIRIKIYCYIAACGLLWSNWCEYKRNLGVEFDEYALRQYRYAKDYYKLVQEESL